MASLVYAPLVFSNIANRLGHCLIRARSNVRRAIQSHSLSSPAKERVKKSQPHPEERPPKSGLPDFGNLVERFLDSNHIKGSMQTCVPPMKCHFPARQHMIGFKESVN